MRAVHRSFGRRRGQRRRALFVRRCRYGAFVCVVSRRARVDGCAFSDAAFAGLFSFITDWFRFRVCGWYVARATTVWTIRVLAKIFQKQSIINKNDRYLSLELLDSGNDTRRRVRTRKRRGAPATMPASDDIDEDGARGRAGRCAARRNASLTGLRTRRRTRRFSLPDAAGNKTLFSVILQTKSNH